MKTPIDTISGSHYEMGKQFGYVHRHLIHGNVHQWPMCHTFQGSDTELDKGVEEFRRANEAIAPWAEDELQGIADGSGADVDWIRRMDLRVWNYVPRREFQLSGCTAIGMISEEEGVVIGGTLDDPREPYVLVRRIPADGIPHVMVAWAGTIWGQNGMNEAGLFMAVASLGVHPDYKDADPNPHPPTGTLTRLIIETCQNVPEALDLLCRSKSNGSWVLGDSSGNLAAIQIMGSINEIQHAADHDNMVFCTNHEFMPGLVEALAAHGCKPRLTDYSVTRFDVLASAREQMPRSSETMRNLLRSHEGFPHSICNDASAMAMMAVPQKYPDKCLYAERPPCRNEFQELPVRMLDMAGHR